MQFLSLLLDSILADVWSMLGQFGVHFLCMFGDREIDDFCYPPVQNAEFVCSEGCVFGTFFDYLFDHLPDHVLTTCFTILGPFGAPFSKLFNVFSVLFFEHAFRLIF